MIENFEVPYKHKPRLCKNFALPDFPAIFFEVFGEKPHQVTPPPPLHPDKAARAGLPAMAFLKISGGVGHFLEPRPQFFQGFQVVVDGTPAAVKAGGELSRGACGFAPDQAIQAV